MIKIFCDKKEKDLVNFWNHMVFHPTNAIEDEWGQRQLEKLAADHAVQVVRIYSMFEESVTQGENGALVYDFSLNDLRIDTLLRLGLTPYIVYAFFPPFLAAEKDESLLERRYKGNLLSRSYPADYAVWEEICRVYTAHLVERYGEDTVAGWHMHCYNEPDLKYFFYWNAPDWKTRAVEYCKLYEAFVRGVTAVSRNLMIGGPGLAGSPNRWSFLSYFLGFVREKGLQLDFISHHCGYGTSPEGMITGEDPLNAKAAVGEMLELRRVVKMAGFEGIPLVGDEWGASTEGYLGCDKCSAFVFRENEIYAAYFAKMLTFYDAVGLDGLLCICMSGAHGLKTDFGGHRNFFSKHFYPKPIYNAFVLAGRLGEEKLYCWADKDRYDQDARDDTRDISVLPTRHKDGHFSVLLCYADDAFRRLLRPITMGIDFEGLPGRCRVTGWRIDADHANAIRKFNELGKPSDPTEAQMEAIREFGRLKPEDLGTVSPDAPVLDLPLDNNTTILLEVCPEA